jgi:hypothetical protein
MCQLLDPEDEDFSAVLFLYVLIVYRVIMWCSMPSLKICMITLTLSHKSHAFLIRCLVFTEQDLLLVYNLFFFVN